MGQGKPHPFIVALCVLALLPHGNVGQWFGFGGSPQGAQTSASSSGGGSFSSIVGGLFNTFLGSAHGRRINAISYDLPTPPTLSGPTALNNDLINAEKVHMGLVNGPGSFVNYKGDLFAATKDSKIYNMARCKPKLIADLRPVGCNGTKACGQLISLRRDPPTGDLIALDTFRGLFRVNIDTGDSKQIYDVNTPVSGRTPVHLNDMIVTKEGLIIMTDSSDAHEFGADIYIGMEGRPSGRLISFYPKSGTINELLPNTFVFPNGLELTHDGKALLLSETGRVRIQKISLDGPTWLQVSTFSSNLPGLPDNIRASDRGTYWVPMSFPRHSRTQNPMDSYSTNSYYRTMGAARMSYTELEAMFSRAGMAVELDSFGRILKSLHDPTGKTMAMVSEVNEFGGVLNIGSPDINYMARLVIPQRGLKVDSFMEIVRSRCKVDDSKVDEIRRQVEEQFFKKPKAATTAAPASLPKH